MAFTRIRWRLAAWNLLVLALVLGVALGVAAIGEIRAHDRALDGELAAAATRIAARAQRRVRERIEHRRNRDHDDRDGDRSHDDDDDDDDERRREHDGERENGRTLGLATSGVPADVIALVVLPGEPAWCNRSPIPRGLPDQATLADARRGETRTWEPTIGGEAFRFVSMPVLLGEHVVGAVQVGKPTREDREALARSLLILLATGVAGLVVALAGSVFLAGRAMRPIAEAFDRQRRFLTDASHELRTPVAVLRARAELLERDGDALPTHVRDEVRTLRRDADELSELLAELLDLTRLDAEHPDIVLEPVAVGDVADDLGAQLAPLAESRAVTLTAKTAPVWATANTSRVRQVLRALADNALKHTHAGGHVRIEVDQTGAWARTRIIDDGDGIAPEHLPRVFDRFYRADEARSRDGSSARGGAGLGLAIAAQLVRLMHGEVRLESAPGSGTVATVLLPLASRGD